MNWISSENNYVRSRAPLYHAPQNTPLFHDTHYPNGLGGSNPSGLGKRVRNLAPEPMSATTHRGTRMDLESDSEDSEDEAELTSYKKQNTKDVDLPIVEYNEIKQNDLHRNHTQVVTGYHNIGRRDRTASALPMRGFSSLSLCERTKNKKSPSVD